MTALAKARTTLTESQAMVLQIIRSYMRDHGGVAPTLRELCDLTLTKSAGSMTKHLNALVEKGFIERNRQGWRRISLRDACPCCGQGLSGGKDG